ncbi:MAG: HAD-IC family P-type ATPase [Candidatus Saccharimonadales bacterium]
MDLSLLSPSKSLEKIKSGKKGLASGTAQKRLNHFGPNELTASTQKKFLSKLIQPFKSIFVLVLLAGAVISIITNHFADAIIILIVVFINAIIEWAQQYSASKVLETLKEYGAKKVKVRRVVNGNPKTIEIDSRQLVPGDVVLLSEGEKVPADGRLLIANSLYINEAPLTGESLPVHKKTAALKNEKPVYEQTNMVFAGTLVQSGRGEFVVSATGNNTEIGRIAKLATLEEKKPPIAKKVNSLTVRLVTATLAATAFTMALGVWRGSTMAEMLRFGVALLVSVIPEGLPITMTVIFLVGIQRMAKKKAFVRKLAAVETLGMVTVIATDKTGTLTHNQLAISETWGLEGRFELEDHQDSWLSVSHKHPDLHHPIEKNITEHTESYGKMPKDWKEIDDLPFETSRRFTVVLWNKKGNGYAVHIKGAPETILAACKVSPKEKGEIETKLGKMTEQGQRVIAVAKKTYKKKPASLRKLAYSNFEFTALIGFEDKVREEAKEAVAKTKRAGIKVYMLTGDHVGTAQAVAQRVGIIEDDTRARPGSIIAGKSLPEIKRLLRGINVFGRVLPEQKFQILKALKQTEITAMTGDGVNDTPALAQAHIGVAMGSGTDAAKEASEIVLLDDNYATLVEAVREGRTIYANIRKMIYYLLSTNIAEVFTIILGLLLGLPLPVTAAQVLWLNIVTDTTMVIPLGLEPPEPSAMQKPPRKPTESLLSNHMLSRLILTGLVMSVSSVVLFKFFLDSHGLVFAQTMAFLSLVVVQWINAFISRSETSSIFTTFKTPNPALWLGLAAGILLQLAVIYTPLSNYLGVVVPAPHYYVWLLIPMSLTLLGGELHKAWFRRA